MTKPYLYLAMACIGWGLLFNRWADKLIELANANNR
jgi:hypothetical protein